MTFSCLSSSLNLTANAKRPKTALLSAVSNLLKKGLGDEMYQQLTLWKTEEWGDDVSGGTSASSGSASNSGWVNPHSSANKRKAPTEKARWFTNKGTVSLIAVQTSFSGDFNTQTIQLSLNAHVWSKLLKRRARGEATSGHDVKMAEAKGDA